MNEKRKSRPPHAPGPRRRKKPVQKEEPKQNIITISLLAVCLFGALYLLIMKQSVPEGSIADREITGGLTVGTVAPVFSAPNSVNGKIPDSKDLKGKVYVLNAWGLGCVYCKKFAPELVKAHSKYKSQGVEFIGMTADTRLFNDKINKYLADQNITWTNGTGAAQFMRDYDVNSIPACWVVGKSGKIIWNFDSESTLDEGIAQALASN